MVQSVSRAIRATACSNCRTSLLRSFTSIAGIQWHANTATATRLWRTPGATQISIRYSSNTSGGSSSKFDQASGATGVSDATQLRNSEATESAVSQELAAEEAIEQEAIEAKATPEADELLEEDTQAETQASSTPWYLQVDTPTINTPTLSERQKIPDLPSSPPTILQPLLERISIDLGLDDLTLLDLRKLDPPPALGSNLIMVIGTARSEKHLHVSADRLCRWLRTEYKLRPDADGLLGRNELKLRLKRKAKRAKLIGSMPHEDDADDGVRTGWVCVNVGTVESAESEVTQQDTGFVGFGRQSDGTKIVVQMLVEEKREELNLERLWSGIARRQTSGLPAEVDADGFVDVSEGSAEEIKPQESSPVVKVHDAYATPFPTTASFSPVAIQPKGGNEASKAR
ncbi:hypothetical protein V495_07821 [Pseudogymnoascus sp. VKM F-4514 (FW-929)]|nr:hypothetical protein V490_05414 [Pseudogymnoascus sp. VKM F-3557]KFY36498.1 hypothetical protein V495_07821 [Pseudogymnoascus sp. VKM F-4514 (FW-929)]KFY58411.1 hypothetical protein V497_04818 [Pseudogymnoascus sp. VKM F-4516 (FW-969)]